MLEESSSGYGSMHDHGSHAHAPSDSHAPAPSEKKERNVNMEAAYLHVLGDLIQSVAVFIAGILIWYKPSWQIADPICTILFSFIVMYSTVGIFKSTVNVLMEGVPNSIEWEQVSRELKMIEGVTEVHDLHIWSISVGEYLLIV